MTDDEEHGHQCCARGLCIICYPEVPEHYLVHDSIAYLALSLIYRFVLCYTGIYRNTRGCRPHSFVLDLQLLYLHQSALRSHSEFGQVFSCHHPHGLQDEQKKVKPHSQSIRVKLIIKYEHQHVKHVLIMNIS